MTNEERTDIKVGLTVIVGIVLLLVGIAWAKQLKIGSHEPDRCLDLSEQPGDWNPAIQS